MLHFNVYICWCYKKTGFGNGAGFGGFGNQNAGAGDRPRVSETWITIF